MKISTFIFFLSLFLVSACVPSPSENTDKETDGIKVTNELPVAQPGQTLQIQKDSSEWLQNPKNLRYDEMMVTETDFTKEQGIYVIDWKMLADIKFEERHNADMNMNVAYPIFNDKLKYLNGKTVKIKGYLLPTSETKSALHVLSANPFSSCFFCGGAGIESVMDLMMKREGISYRTDQVLTFQGTLCLNDSDLYYLNYILKDSEIAYDDED